MRTPTRLLGLLLCALALSVAASAVAFANAGNLSAIYQGYSTAAGQDPYGNDANMHVGGYGGQPGVTAYVRLNFESLPPGSNVDGLRLKLVPTSSTTDNINTGAAAFQACVLNAPLTSNGYQANPPAYDCAVHANAEAQSDGSWAIELGPLVPRWKTANTGLALVAYPPPNGTPVSATPSAWSLAFAHDKTSAAVDYSPGRPAPDTFAVPPAVTEPLPPSSALAAPAIAPAVTLPGLAAPAAPAAVPSQAPVAPTAPGPALVNRPRLDKQWVWVTGALGGTALLMLLVGAGQQALRSGRFNLGAALAASRSQLATPISVLSLAAVFSLGATTQTVAVLQPGAGGATAAGGASGSSAAGVQGPAGAALSGTGAGAGGSAGGPVGSTAAGSAPGGGAGSGNDPRNGPGVTATTVRLGFVYTVNAQAANAAFGFSTPNTGNQQSEEQALVDYVNHHGGIAGRQIQPVYVAYDNGQAESDPNINEKICIEMTEDYHVFAVIGGGGPPDDVAANACYAQHGTMNFDLEQAEPDLSFLRQTSPYIWLTSAAAQDRVMKMEITGLQHQGYFASASSHRYGVIVAEDKLNEGVYNSVTLPALHAAGASNVEDFEVPHDTVSDVANTMKQAVARFQIDKVDRVIFQGGGNYGTGSYAVLFMVNAESQHYNPRYGLSSDDGPVGIAADVPQDQLQGALAVGITPIDDTDDAHYAPWPSTSNEKRCAGIEAAAGNSFSRRLDAGVALFLCNAMFELQQGGQPLSGGPLNAQLWADQAMQLGNSVFSDSMYRAFVGPSHWDSAGGYRLLHAVQNCSGSNACFVYDDSNIYS